MFLPHFQSTPDSHFLTSGLQLLLKTSEKLSQKGELQLHFKYDGRIEFLRPFQNFKAFIVL
jgi:hypothetical protein